MSENSSAYRLWEHPANTRSIPNEIDYILDKQGNQQIILLQTLTFFKDNPAPAIYIPLEFERNDLLLQSALRILTLFLLVILILLAALIYKKESTDLGILTIIALLFTSYQFLAIDKPVGFTTTLDWVFLFFITASLVLFTW